MGRAVVYFQSGGPTSIINTSLYGVIMEARKHSEFSKILGSRYGVEGLLNDELIDLNQESQEEIDLLLQTPGAILGSSRKKLPKEDGPIYDQIIATLEKRDVGYLLVNGGNDSMDTCDKLGTIFSQRGLDIKVIGIPKTVDNDLYGSDHSLGFPSAAKYACNAVMGAIEDLKAYKKGKVLIVELMGRDTGWLTASTFALPKENRPDFFLLPELPFEKGELLEKVKKVYEAKGRCVIACSEGVHIERKEGVTDEFGHASLEGSAHQIEAWVKQLGFATRSMSLSIPQRSASFLLSSVDRKEAIRCSEFAVKSLLKGQTKAAVGIRRVSSNPYQSEPILLPCHDVANAVRGIPTKYLKDIQAMDGSFLEYMRPLLSGEPDVVYENGLLRYSRFLYIKP